MSDAAVVPAMPTLRFCCSKACKKVPKPEPEDSAMCSRDNEGCTQNVHIACLAAVLAAFGASSDFIKHVCSKRCYNAVIKQAKVARRRRSQSREGSHGTTTAPTQP